MGQGGIIPIQAKYYPSGTLLDLKLTGMQGDVMKESMNVAKTLAWSLCDSDCVLKMLNFMIKQNLKDYIFIVQKVQHQKMDHLQELQLQLRYTVCLIQKN